MKKILISLPDGLEEVLDRIQKDNSIFLRTKSQTILFCISFGIEKLLKNK